MARILVEGEWYEQLSPNSLYEADFERIIISKSDLLFPGFYTAEFKCIVETEDGEVVKPDLALIDKYYRHWWVVETEIASHSLLGHVLPQIRRISSGIYGHPQAAYLARINRKLSRDKLADMMKGQPPGILVIVNSPCPKWISHLNKFDALLSILEVFKSRSNKLTLRVNGEYPSLRSDLLSECKLDSLLPNFLEIKSPSALAIPRHGKITIVFEGYATHWERVDSKDQVWLNPIGPCPVRKNETYEIVRRDDGELIMRLKRKLRRYHK